ncbi:MAG: hypothetical protein HKN39_05000 [Flavobacteriales bacterium]|nr:hypothetical protein [Flavobacteriales bacterium]
MTRRKTVLFCMLKVVVLTILMSSCTSNKKIVYLQDKEASKPHDALVDNTYPAPRTDWLLEAEDVLSVRINHLTSPGSSVSNFSNDDRSLLRSTIPNPNIHGYTIDENGNIDLPIVGKVNVAGMPLKEATNKIREAANRVFSSPSVKVHMINFRISVLGSVNTPGQYLVYNNTLNIFEALSLANDADDYSNKEGVKVLRTRNGKNHLYHLDLTDEQLLTSEAFYIHPSDVIIVSPLKRKKWSGREAQSLYAGLGVVVSLTSLIIALTR